MTAPSFVLASGSPRRRDLLAGLGYRFIVRPGSTDETPRPNEAPDTYVARLARDKAREAARPGEIVLAADTVVTLDGELLGKPRDDAQARTMLGELAGRTHAVLTGVTVIDAGGAAATHVERTDVRFLPMTDAEIAWYVATGEPADKAGAYGIQGRGALFVASIDGNYSNVVGLPLPVAAQLLRAAGVRPPTADEVARVGR